MAPKKKFDHATKGAPPVNHEVINMPVHELIGHEKNARRHPADQVAKLAASIVAFGFTNPILIDLDGCVLAGHGRLAAAKSIGMTTVPVIRLPLAGDAARAYMLADNKLGELSTWDVDQLSAELKVLADVPLDLGDLDLGDLFGTSEPVVHSTERVPIDEVKPHPRNYRDHPADQVDHIVASIQANGLYRNAIIAKDGTILAGHGLVLALRKMGAKTVPCLRLGLAPTDPRALRILTWDNEIARGGDIDDRKMTTILAEVLDSDDLGLLGTGFNEEQLRALLYLTRPAAEDDTGEDEAAAKLPQPGAAAPVLKINFADPAAREDFCQAFGIVIDKATEREWIARWPKDGAS